MRRPHALSRDVTVDTESPPPRPPPRSLWGWLVGAKKPWGSDPALLPLTASPAHYRLFPQKPHPHFAAPPPTGSDLCLPNPILAATVWLALAAQVLPGARLEELRESLFWLDPCSLTSHVFYPRTLGGTEYRLLHLGQSPGSQFPLGFSPRVVTRASLLAEDEADVLNNGLDSEERISVPSCYGGVGAPVSRQGENRGLRGFGSPAAGEGLREGTRPREAWTYSGLLWVSHWSPDSPPHLACTVPKGL